MKIQALALIAVIMISGAIMDQIPSIGGSDTTEIYEAKQPNQSAVVGSSIGDQPTTSAYQQSSSTEFTESEQSSSSTAPTSLGDGEGSPIVENSGLSVVDVVERKLGVVQESNTSSCLDINATIYLAKGLNTQEVLFQKNASYRWPAASITKMIGAVVVMEEYDFSSSIEITQDIVDAVAPYNNFTVGEEYSVNDLVRAAMVASSNDAMYALASRVGVEEFVEKMNAKAKQIGMSSSLFWEPSGLSYLNQTTANDLYALMQYVYHTHPTLLETSRKTSVSVRDLNAGKSTTLKNTNLFAGRKEFYGGKTGYIDESGQNLLTLFNDEGTLVVLLVMGSPDRFDEVEAMYHCLP